MKIDFLCQVVDNFGDIAVVWRLIKSLFQEAGAEIQIRLMVDDLETFQQLVPSVKQQDEQVLDMREFGYEQSVLVAKTQALISLDFYSNEPADVLVEAFGAVTPDCYFEAFKLAALDHPRIILHLEYLTAEEWSQEYHLLPSLLPWPGIRKFFFVPGFLPGAGGVIIDQVFWKKVLLSGVYGSLERRVFRHEVFQRLGLQNERAELVVSVFSYEHDYKNLWEDLAAWVEQTQRAALVLVFEGRQKKGAQRSFREWSQTCLGQSLLERGLLEVKEVPFLAQSDYDDLLLAGDFHVVRGEESWVRAVLSGRPFLWHAYLQPEGFQKVKTAAFLKALLPFFMGYEHLFAMLEREFLVFNDRLVNSDEESPAERYRVFLDNLVLLETILRKMAKEVAENRNLTRKMLDFLQTSRL